MKGEQKKRIQRAENFTRAETLLLIKLVKKYEHLVENKKTDTDTNKKKEAAWNRITAEFNAAQVSTTRTCKSLKGKRRRIRGGSPVPELDNVDDQSISSDISRQDTPNDTNNITDFVSPELVLISNDTCIEIIADDGFDAKQILEDNLEKETQKDHNGFNTKQVSKDNQKNGETEEEYVCLPWDPNALKMGAMKTKGFKADAKTKKVSEEIKLDILNSAQLELVELQIQTARKELQFKQEEHDIKMQHLQNEEKRKQELHQITINNMRRNNIRIIHRNN